MIISLSHIAKSFGPTLVLADVSLVVNEGDRLALVGPNGAGKSTLAKLIARFYDPTEGAITFGGVDLRRATMASLRERMVVVPQEGFLFGGTVADNIRIARPDATDADVCAALGVDAVVNSPSFTLMAEYEGRLPLFHQDLYRLAGAEEAIAARNAQSTPALARARLFTSGPVLNPSSPEQARELVAKTAATKVDIIKIRVDDNLGSAGKMAEPVWRATIAKSDELKAQVAKLEESYAERVRMRGVAEADCNALRDEIAGRLGELEAERAKAAAEVPGDVLAQYQRLHELREDDAMAPVEITDRRRHEYNCGACMMSLPMEVSISLLGGKLTICSNCQCILYLPPEAAEAITPSKR